MTEWDLASEEGLAQRARSEWRRCPKCQHYLHETRLQSGLCASCDEDFKAPVLDPPTAVRTFASGATRDTDQGKFDYEAFLSPLVVERYGRYMHKNRHLSDGTLRDGGNWQHGIPVEAYQKSLWRHMMAAWKRWRGWDQTDLQEHLCGVLFNTMGLLHELLKEDLPASSNGKTPDFESGDRGSSPCAGAFREDTCDTSR